MTSSTLVHTINRQLITNSQASSANKNNSTYTLTSSERIAALEAELFNLQKVKETPIAAVRTRAQRSQDPAEAEEEQAVTTARKAIPRIEEVEDVDAAPRQSPVIIPNSQPSTTEHPFRNARDAAYMPPVNRNIAAK